MKRFLIIAGLLAAALLAWLFLRADVAGGLPAFCLPVIVNISRTSGPPAVR